MKVLVIHGAGLNMRGRVQVEVFGPMTLPQYEEHIRGYAKGLGIEVEFFHSNIEGEVVNRLYQAFDSDIAGVVINPGGYTTVNGPLRAAVAQMKCPVIEVHLSNPAARGTVSVFQAVCKASLCGFGIETYRYALTALQGLVGRK
ncbi:MAG: type II 3-dehydroquinate dehydratase [Betaproteobacteria bacterium]|jgi:3-dehydroquinate dehydratase-2|nr:3-dehydroquinate dehydratase [Betaproteobacteria bacterium]